ncbi:hypothetical protein Trydic_g5444 [Trypoxylus dichotomus]
MRLPNDEGVRESTPQEGAPTMRSSIFTMMSSPTVNSEMLQIILPYGYKEDNEYTEQGQSGSTQRIDPANTSSTQPNGYSSA